MKLYGATLESLTEELKLQREKLVTAKTSAEKQLCMSSIYLLDRLCSGITQVDGTYFAETIKKNRAKFTDGLKFSNKHTDYFNVDFAQNKDFYHYLTARAVNVYAKEIDKFPERDYFCEDRFSEDTALLLVHDFFKKYHQDDLEYVDTLIKNSRILRVDAIDDLEGVCINIYNSLPIIAIKNPDFSIASVSALIHEFGHAVDFKKVSDNYSINKAEKYLFLSNLLETVSRLYEKQAYEYFINNEINTEYALNLLDDFHFTNYYNLLNSYILSLLPDELIYRDNYLLYSKDEMMSYIPNSEIGDDIISVFDEKFEKVTNPSDPVNALGYINHFNLKESLTYGVSGMFATLLDSKIKEDREKGLELYNRFLACRLDSFRPELFEELGFDRESVPKILKKEINYFYTK